MTSLGRLAGLVLLLFRVVLAYKPVVIIHGILTGADSMLTIEQEIKKQHPGTIVYNTDRFGGWSSLENAWRQVQELGADLMEICRQHPEGVHLLGYSQGGLIARAILQSFPDHNVQNFISLSSPQAGQFGAAFLHLIFPSLAAKTAFELFYTYAGQHCSVANYWNDPHHQALYHEFSAFLPYVNNEIRTSNSTQFREGLLKLRKMVLVGGPNDGVITPWQSSHFGYYDEYGAVVPMRDRAIYEDDTIGLRTLEKDGRLELLTFDHVHHMAWHINTSVIDKAVLAHLD